MRLPFINFFGGAYCSDSKGSSEEVPTRTQQNYHTSVLFDISNMGKWPCALTTLFPTCLQGTWLSSLIWIMGYQGDVAKVMEFSNKEKVPRGNWIIPDCGHPIILSEKHDTEVSKHIASVGGDRKTILELNKTGDCPCIPGWLSHLIVKWYRYTHIYVYEYVSLSYVSIKMELGYIYVTSTENNISYISYLIGVVYRKRIPPVVHM